METQCLALKVLTGQALLYSTKIPRLQIQGTQSMMLSTLLQSRELSFALEILPAIASSTACHPAMSQL